MPKGRHKDEFLYRGHRIYLEDGVYPDNGLPDSGAKQAARLAAKVGLPVGWSNRFVMGKGRNGTVYSALGEEGLAFFSKWARQLMAERISRPNEAFGIPLSVGPGPESLHAIRASQIEPAVEGWVEENFYDPPEVYLSRVGFFQSERKVREIDSASHQQRVADWRQEKIEFSSILSGAVLEQVVWSMAGLLGVPERLHKEFTEWALRQPSRTFMSLSKDFENWSNQPEFPDPPAEAPQGISHEQYEAYCCSMLQSWGYLDASTTRFVQDGGVDVESADLVVQCKHVKGNVGAPDIQKIFGIASKEQKTAVVFSAGGFTKEGLKWASEAGVALITLREIDGAPKPQNQVARMVMARRTQRD